MRLAIVTLPLHTNYGGLLQAYALKSCLESMGHEADVLDMVDKMPGPKCWKAPMVYAARMFKRALKGSSGPEVFRERRFRREFPIVSAETSVFVEKYISPRPIRSFKDVKEGEYDAFVVGSDQVWRPLYFPGVENAFLAFAEGWDVKRVAYAASFGTDDLEFEYVQLEECSKLLAEFDAVSVRESIGVKMCSEWFDRDDAVHVLDPVMLIDSARIKEMADSSRSHVSAGKVMTYILDSSSHKRSIVDFIARVSGKDVFDFPVNAYNREIPVSERVARPVEDWLAAFADADFVVTDSFHGCVLSILLHKKFIAVGNSMRGMARMQSLLDMFGLDSRLVHGIDPEDDGEFFLSDPDWEQVDMLLSERRKASIDFLMDNLK